MEPHSARHERYRHKGTSAGHARFQGFLWGGILLVASGQGVWMVEGDKRSRDQNGRLVFRLRRLSDTAILGYPAQQSGEVWLCAVNGQNCEWSRVAVTSR